MNNDAPELEGDGLYDVLDSALSTGPNLPENRSTRVGSQGNRIGGVMGMTQP